MYITYTIVRWYGYNQDYNPFRIIWPKGKITPAITLQLAAISFATRFILQLVLIAITFDFDKSLVMSRNVKQILNFQRIIYVANIFYDYIYPIKTDIFFFEKKNGRAFLECN